MDDIPQDVGVPYDEPPTPGEKIPKRPSKKEQAKEQLKDAAKDQVKRAASQVIKKAAAAIARAIASAAASAAAWVVASIGWPLLAICLVVFILVALIFGGLICTAESGYFGKTYPHEAGKDDPNVQKILELANAPSRVLGFNKIDFKDAEDRQYVSQDKIDDRLARALTYLSSQHEMIRISHIISEYEYMNLAEAGTDTDPRIIKNISAHKDGLAADIDQLDFVYKVFEENTTCSAETGGVAGDTVYYNDKNEELLRLNCLGTIFSELETNTTWEGKPAVGIPIKILYQDCKPNIEHAGNEPNPCITITDPVEIIVHQMVYQPEARRKTHASISEMLTFPNTTNDINHYKITQLITFSNSRDVKPFQDDGTLDKLYGNPRPANLGLFWLLESWQNIHIAY